MKQRGELYGGKIHVMGRRTKEYVLPEVVFIIHCQSVCRMSTRITPYAKAGKDCPTWHAK